MNQIKGTPYRRCIDVGGGLYKDFEADLSEQVGNKQQSLVICLPLPVSGLLRHEWSNRKVGNRVAAIFESLDGTVGNEGHLGFRMPSSGSLDYCIRVLFNPMKRLGRKKRLNMHLSILYMPLRGLIKGKGE